MDPTYKGLSAPTPNSGRSSSGLDWRRGLFFTAGLVGLIVIIALVSSMLTPNTTNITQRLLYRLDALTTMATSARSNIRDDSLSKINADLSLILNGDYLAIKKATPVVQMNAELTAIKK